MKFLTILATVFCGGTVLVGADYYIEFRAPGTGASSSSARAQPRMASYMYECKFPAGTSAFSTNQSRCTPVNPSAKKGIHATHTFYSVFNANLNGHVIHLSDSGIMPNNLIWMLGYKNDAIDHPNFADPSRETIAYLRDRVEEMRMFNAVPAKIVPPLAEYFAQTNLISLTRNLSNTKIMFAALSNFLRKVGEMSNNLHLERDPARDAPLQAQITLAIQVSLQKMIDPCSLSLSNLQSLASRHCGTYCYFLGVAARYYGDAASRRHPLEGGHCVGVVCNCIKVVSAVQGCQMIRMHEVNNALRMNLLDHWTGPVF